MDKDAERVISVQFPARALGEVCEARIREGKKGCAMRILPVAHAIALDESKPLLIPFLPSG